MIRILLDRIFIHVCRFIESFIKFTKKYMTTLIPFNECIYYSTLFKEQLPVDCLQIWLFQHEKLIGNKPVKVIFFFVKVVINYRNGTISLNQNMYSTVSC